MEREEFLKTYIKYRRFIKQEKKCIVEILDTSGNAIQNKIENKLKDIDSKIGEKAQMNIFQTWKINKIPKIALKPVTTWKYLTKGWKYHLYNDKNCLQFIRENFNEQILAIYCSLPFGVMRADFWRYCILYKKGGLYADLDSSCLVSPVQWIPKDAEFVVSGELRTPLFCQWTFYSKKNSPILKKIIDVVCSRIIRSNLKDIKASMIHKLTGPEAFTSGIVTTIKELAIKDNNKSLLPLINSETLKNRKNARINNFLKKHKIYILPNGVFDGLYVQHHYGGSRWNYVGYSPWKLQLKSILQRKKI
jgi:inositol phosphorylceramide mannosyltransferase catalytic subunit